MATAEVATRPAPTPQFCNRSEPGSTNIAAATFPVTTKNEPKDVDGIATRIVERFNKSLSAEDVQGIINLFCDDCYWRDHLCLSWDYRTLKGKEKISDFLGATTRGLKKLDISRSTSFRAPHYGVLDGAGETKGIEFFVDIDTEIGVGLGLVRLVEESAGSWKIFCLFTSLRELKGYESADGPRRPNGVQHGGKPDRKNWQDQRNEDFFFENGTKPAVIIVGECDVV